jgi:hypothetical protein
MGFTSPLVLSSDKPTDVATTTVSYAVRAVDIDRGVYSISGLTYPAEQVLTIATAIDKNLTKRHVVKVSKTMLDSLNVPGTASVALTCVRPANSAFTNAELLKMLNQVLNFCASGGGNALFVQVLNGEM